MNIKKLTNEELLNVYNIVKEYIEFLNNELTTEDEK